MSLFELGRFSEAALDLDKLATLVPEDLDYQLWLFAARERSGSDGKRALASASGRIELDHWPGAVVSFLLGKSKEADLLREAKDVDRQKELEQLCGAYFYAGQMQMIRGKTKEAAALFQKSVDTNVTTLVEFSAARAELTRMGTAQASSQPSP
jgi:lipoprotein NlpI